MFKNTICKGKEVQSARQRLLNKCCRGLDHHRVIQEQSQRKRLRLENLVCLLAELAAEVCIIGAVQKEMIDVLLMSAWAWNRGLVGVVSSRIQCRMA